MIKKKINDDEAFDKFFRDCYLRILRPATITLSIKKRFLKYKINILLNNQPKLCSIIFISG
ncbi:hypothetical protein BTR22_11960 [Alkalihalophilus pseudofirmus]|nr:hypothetical protein BTR22_11960 [Alkalihalophilus pseudofirmus]